MSVFIHSITNLFVFSIMLLLSTRISSLSLNKRGSVSISRSFKYFSRNVGNSDGPHSAKVSRKIKTDVYIYFYIFVQFDLLFFKYIQKSVDSTAVKEIAKRKLALVCGYVGTNYYGLQMSSGSAHKTVEVNSIYIIQ